MFLRTGLLLFYLLLTTRTATRISPEAGATHQAIRQFWTFTALFLDAFSVTAQSLIAFFIGKRDLDESRRVARVVCLWCFGMGVLLSVIMIGGISFFIRFLVPPSAVAVFTSAWLIAAFSQPINSLAFATDGIHWGTGDYGYLRNGMIAATATGSAGIVLMECFGVNSMNVLWSLTALWIMVRAVAGMIRVWPGIGNSPLKRPQGSLGKLEGKV